jgi:hypothetical protein
MDTTKSCQTDVREKRALWDFFWGGDVGRFLAARVAADGQPVSVGSWVADGDGGGNWVMPVGPCFLSAFTPRVDALARRARKRSSLNLT